MLHRVKKENDINRDKWVGIGGKFLEKESPSGCARREIKEETGALPIGLKYRGIVTFVSNLYGTEYMHLFTADGLDGEIDYECDEGVLEWIDKNKVLDLPCWEGDKIFLGLLNENAPFFSVKLTYDGDKLVSHEIEY